MAEYSASKITNSGTNLLILALQGLAEIQFTRMAFGSGDVNSSELVAMDKLKNEVQSVALNSLTAKSTNSVCVEAILSNENLTAGYKVTEIGLFARNKNDESAGEVLYAVCCAIEGFADYMPAYNGYAPAKLIQSFYIEVANTSSTTILADDVALVSRVYLQENYYNKNNIDNILDYKFGYKNIHVDTLDKINNIVEHGIYCHVTITAGILPGITEVTNGGLFVYGSNKQLLITDNGAIYVRTLDEGTNIWGDFLLRNSFDVPEIVEVNHSSNVTSSVEMDNITETCTKYLCFSDAEVVVKTHRIKDYLVQTVYNTVPNIRIRKGEIVDGVVSWREWVSMT